MYRIVEGVERLVDSDAGDAVPTGPDSFSFLDGAGPPTPQARFFGGSLAATPLQDINTSRGSGTPMAPPGLYPPIRNPSGSGQSFSQPYTPRPSLPGIPSIWNTNFSPQAPEVPSPRTPRTPPGLGQNPIGSMVPNNNNSAFLPREPIAGDFPFGRNLAGLSQIPSSFGQTNFSSPWTTTQHFPGASLRRDAFDGVDSYSDRFSQPATSSSLANASWANNAFVASSIPSGADYPGLGFNSSRRSASQLGAIGQTPSYGQWG